MGRAAVLADLGAQLRAALAGHGQVLLIQGEPGVGKTRLLQELAARARKREALVVTVHVHELSDAKMFANVGPMSNYHL